MDLGYISFFSQQCHLSYEVHDSEVQHNMCKNEVCKSSFWADLFKLTLVGWIDLKAEASCCKNNKIMKKNCKNSLKCG